MSDLIGNALHMAKSFIGKVQAKGGVAIDATAGKGNDTLFLANLVGPGGKVFSFDIQPEAINFTQALLLKNGLSNVELINDSHENLKEYVSEPVDVVMFNLGYLPGGDHNIITRPETTRLAVMQALELLKPGGILTIVIYTGHTGSRAEADLLEEALFGLDQSEFTLFKGTYPNQKNNPPYLLAIMKKP